MLRAFFIILLYRQSNVDIPCRENNQRNLMSWWWWWWWQWQRWQHFQSTLKVAFILCPAVWAPTVVEREGGMMPIKGRKSQWSEFWLILVGPSAVVTIELDFHCGHKLTIKSWNGFLAQCHRLCKCFYKLREQLLIQSIFLQVRSPIRSPKQMQQELHSAHSVQVLCTW